MGMPIFLYCNEARKAIVGDEASSVQVEMNQEDQAYRCD